LPSDHDLEADSVLGRGGNKRGPHIYNKQHGRIHDKATMNNMNMHNTVLDTWPISSDKDIIANIITYYCGEKIIINGGPAPKLQASVI